LPSTPSARTGPPSAENPDSSSDITLHAALPETHETSWNTTNVGGDGSMANRVIKI
jgi:hypothetical protein